MSQSFEEYSAERKRLQAEGVVPEWYTTQGWQLFKEKYAVTGELGVKGRFETIARTLSQYMPDQKEWEFKFFNLLWKGWLSPATPVLANTGTERGLTVSCSGQYVGDSIESFFSNRMEAAILSKHGFGCSAYMSDIRPRGSSISKGGKANGPVPVIKGFAKDSSEVSQGGNRRGSIASYLDIEHPDFDELCDFLFAEPAGLNIGWTIKDSFINKLKLNDEEAQRRFKKTLKTKLVTGKGYYHFIDKVNRHRPQMYVDQGLDVKASNLCSEINLHSSEKYTYSCILSSMNIYKYDEWKDTDAIFDATVFLDCVTSDFLSKARHIKGLEKVVSFTERGRAIGLGLLGFATYLQAKRIPYESFEAGTLNSIIAKKLHNESLRASQFLAQLLGEPEWCKGYGVRHTHRTALAPTKSTALLMGGVSESISPDPGMVFDGESAAGQMRRIVPELYNLLKEKGIYNEETITFIIQNKGSVQGLPQLTNEEKLVFRNAFEMNQEVLLRYAVARQRWLCQGQSLNVYVSEEGDELRIADLHSQAFLHEMIHSMYYIYSRSGVIVSTECLACEA